MWSIRILNGKMAGQIFQIGSGTTTLGRAPNCDVVINSQSVSKEHAKVEILSDKIILTDLGSRNGTFVNGVQIRSQKVQAGDKIALNDIIIEITDKMIKMPAARPRRPSAPQYGGNLPAVRHPQMPNSPPLPQMHQAPMAYDGANALQPDLQQYPGGMPQASAPPAAPQAPGFVTWAQNYFENVVLPGVYRLPEWMEFRWVIGLFTLAFVITVTCFSAIPLTRILKDSVERESQNRAKTIARNLADRNRGAIQQGLISALSTEWADNEPGVDRAYIISQANGEIMAPANLAGRASSEAFVNTARKLGQETTEQIDDSTVGVLVPIAFLNPNTGATSIQANAVVIYNMGTLAVSGEKTLALLVQVMFLAVLFGGILYYFLIRLIEHPIVQLNKQVKKALDDGKSEIAVTYLFPQLQELASNVNNAVQRALSGDLGAMVGQNYEFDRSNEMLGLVNALPVPALVLNQKELSIITTNSLFSDAIARGQDWSNSKIEAILEQSLRLNLNHLLATASQDSSYSAQDELEINNVMYSLKAQGIHGAKELAYVVVTFTPKGQSYE